jgi:hypothetical protein
MSDGYDRHEIKVFRRGLKPQKVIAAYKHFGSLRKTAKVCGISKDTVKEILERYEVVQITKANLPKKASYNPKKFYSDFALWHKAHANDKDLPTSVTAIAALAGVTSNIVKCYFYRRRKDAAKLLNGLPDLRKLALLLEDIEGKSFSTKKLRNYRFAIDRFSERAALQGFLKDEPDHEVTAIIPSITVFADRVRKYGPKK